MWSETGLEWESMMIILPFNIGDTVFYKQQQYSGKYIIKPLVISQLEITKDEIKQRAPLLDKGRGINKKFNKWKNDMKHYAQDN